MHPATAANGPTGPTDWKAVNWRQANRQVRNLRRRIFRATQDGDWNKVRSLQKLMLRSYANTLVSVRRVTQVNQGKNTAGVDKVVIKTPTARGKFVDDLRTYQPWRAKPARRVYIPKASGTLRPLGIPTIRDRALQAMVKNALEPSWEARFEGSSYGFRPGRSCHDAITKVYITACPHRRKKWVVDADIEGAFDHIDHAFLLHAIGPIPGRELIRQWLKAGYMDDFVWYPTDAGTPQGGVLSPLLANIALHGLEDAMGLRKGRRGWLADSKRAVVRYADDFVVFCETREDAEATIGELQVWLAERGLSLSPAKTRIVHLTEGFDFLGFTIRHYRAPKTSRSGYKLLITPSRDSVYRFRDRMRQEWRTLKGHNATRVIQRLNPILRGWATYFRVGVSSHTFHALDHWTHLKAWRWAERSHRRKSRTWVKERYFGRWNPHRQDTWVFGDKRTGRYLLRLGWFRIERHPLVRGSASPDDARLQTYWRKRAQATARSLRPSHRRLAQRQQYACPRCGEALLNGEELHVHHLVPVHRGGTNRLDNLQLVHLYCHQQAHSHRPVSQSDLLEPDA